VRYLSFAVVSIAVSIQIGGLSHGATTGRSSLHYLKKAASGYCNGFVLDYDLALFQLFVIAFSRPPVLNFRISEACQERVSFQIVCVSIVARSCQTGRNTSSLLFYFDERLPSQGNWLLGIVVQQITTRRAVVCRG